MMGLGLRVAMTSRPEIPIRLRFQKMKHIAYHELALHDVPRAIVDQDIEKFVRHELFQIKTERVLPGSWPERTRFGSSQLVQMVFSSTLLLYVDMSTDRGKSHRFV
jgi:hypothetical protein